MIYRSEATDATIGSLRMSDVSTNSNEINVGDGLKLSANTDIVGSKITLSVSGSATTPINNTIGNSTVFFTLKDGNTVADKLIKVVLTDVNSGFTTIYSAEVVTPTAE